MAFSEKFAEAFIDKLLLLEQTAPITNFKLMPTFDSPFHDYISIQKTAKKIADFVGLSGYTFIVTIAKQNERVGGHIDLSNNGKEVFIEIDQDMMKFPDSIATVLCHEICHKWLYEHSIKLPIEIENEILTDITSIYLGFGRIVLNGCRGMNYRQETTNTELKRITETMKTGYLDINQYAFVYHLVCTMREIPESVAIEQLSQEARQAFYACQSKYSHIFNSSISIKKSISDFKKSIKDFQFSLAELNKCSIYTKKVLLDAIDAFSKKCHKNLIDLNYRINQLERENSVNTSLTYLHTIKNHYNLWEERDSVLSMEIETDLMLKKIKRMLTRFPNSDSQFPMPSAEMFTYVNCPQDDTVLRLPKNSGKVMASCPNCHYRFAYNTSVPNFVEEETKSNDKRKRSLWDFLKIWGK